MYTQVHRADIRHRAEKRYAETTKKSDGKTHKKQSNSFMLSFLL